MTDAGRATFDAIVIGLGAHGSGAVLALARRGLRVLGIETGERGHELGSSGGRSRMIRRAYFEDPAYVPLLDAAWDAWREIGEAAGELMIEVTGGLYAGLVASDVVRGSAESAVAQGIDHEVLDAHEIGRRWPIFDLPADVAGLFDPAAGAIRPERAIGAMQRLAEQRGAILRFGEPAGAWRRVDGALEVETNVAVHRSEHLVIAAGAWTGAFVPDLALPLEVERVPVFWFEPNVRAFELSIGRMPMWLVDTGPSGVFYGFPYDPAAGLKISRHHSEEVVDADAVDRTEHAADVERVRAFIEGYMPAADGPVRTSTVCLYTNTPDHHFIIDAHPVVAGVAFASACSGHGFKFAPVVGELLADLALGRVPPLAIDRFRADRFSRQSSAGHPA